jgi:hypothetical protein
MFYWYNKEVKRKKMKKIAIAFGIIVSVTVLSLLVTSASASVDNVEDWMGCPGGWGDLHSRGSAQLDPANIYYVKAIKGTGYEDCRATIATHTRNAGLGASMSSRGSALIEDYQTFTVDTHPDTPQLDITSEVSKSYRGVRFNDELVKPHNSALSGETCVKSYMVGAMVSEKYRDTYDISGDFEHTGSGTSSSTKITDRRIYGTSQFAVTVNDIVEHHHNIMRVRDEHTGEFEMDREVTVTRYGGPNEEP